MQITRGKIIGAQKIVVYGPEGIGKSTFAAMFPNPVFIDTEGSTKHMDVLRTPKPSSWVMLLEQVKYFKVNPYQCDSLIIDTADWAEQLCMNDICAKANKSGIEDFGYGKGYVYLTEEFGRLLNLLEEIVELGINVVLTAHAQMRKFEQPDEMGSYDRWEMKLQKKIAPLVKEWADMVLFANYETYVIKTDDKKNKAQGGKRVMHTTHHPCWDAKNRHNLDLKLNFDYKEIEHCIVTRGGAQAPTTAKDEVPIEKTSAAQIGPNKAVEAGIHVESSQEQQSSIKTYPQVNQEEQKIESAKDNLEGIPKALADLMNANNVTVREVQQAVASRGYYPEDTPIDNYDSSFITGVLVSAWPQVFKMIQDIRNGDDIPF